MAAGETRTVVLEHGKTALREASLRQQGVTSREPPCRADTQTRVAVGRSDAYAASIST
jgi:hypothetical protein